MEWKEKKSKRHFLLTPIKEFLQIIASILGCALCCPHWLLICFQEQFKVWILIYKPPMVDPWVPSYISLFTIVTAEVN